MSSSTVTRLARALTWLIVGAVAFLSLIPGSGMISVGHGVTEHFAAYLVFAAAAALGYGRLFGYGWLAFAAVAAAGLFEAAQILAPGRTPSISDFAASALGALTGGTAAAWIRSTIRG